MARNSENRKPRKFNKLVCLAAVGLLLISSIGVGRAYAKYINKNEMDANLTSPQFYFESDLLKEGGAEYILNATTQKISIDLKNHADLLRWSDDNIGYTITMKWTSKINGIEYTEKLTGNIANDAPNTATVEFTVNPSDSSTYVISAEGKAGYVKTLSATFHISPLDNNLYKYTDTPVGEPYILLTVWTESLDPAMINVDFPVGVIPDNTWPGMSAIETENGEFSFYMESYSSRTFRFFKDVGYDPNNDFSVTLGSVPAIEKTPE